MFGQMKKSAGAMQRRFDKIGMAPAMEAPKQETKPAQDTSDRGPITERQGTGGTAKGPNKKGQTY